MEVKDWYLRNLGFPGGSVVKHLPAMQEMQETQAQSLGWEDPLEKDMATCSNILVWKTTEWLSSHSLRNCSDGNHWTLHWLVWRKTRDELDVSECQALVTARILASRLPWWSSGWLHALSAGGSGSVPVLGITSCILQLRVPHATTKIKKKILHAATKTEDPSCCN